MFDTIDKICISLIKGKEPKLMILKKQEENMIMETEVIKEFRESYVQLD